MIAYIGISQSGNRGIQTRNDRFCRLIENRYPNTTANAAVDPIALVVEGTGGDGGQPARPARCLRQHLQPLQLPANPRGRLRDHRSSGKRRNRKPDQHNLEIGGLSFAPSSRWSNRRRSAMTAVAERDGKQWAG